MIDIFCKNATIVTVDKERRILWDGAMAVKDGRILEIGDSAVLCDRYKEETIGEVIDCAGKVLFPGFINTHTHLFQNLLKGLGDDMVLADWLRTMTFPAAAHLTAEDCRTAAMIGVTEGIRSGTTTTLDYMYAHTDAYFSDAVIDAFKAHKIRGIFARGGMDTGEQFGVAKGILQSRKTIVSDVERLFSKYHNTENGRVKIWVAPAAAWSNTAETLKELYELTSSYQSGFTIHTSETPFDRESTRQLHGAVDAELLSQLGIAGPNVLMVHCVYLTDRDIRMAQYYDMKVSHNAASNMYLSSGVAPVPKMLMAGIGVGLGVDGAASNNSQDMIELLKLTALQHKVATLDPTGMTAEKVLEMATIDGARAIGMEDEIGSLEVGKKADFVVFNPLLSAKSVPMHNPVSTLVYSSSEKNIETVVVDGNILLKDGKFVFIDEEAVLREGQACAERLAQRAQIVNRGAGHAWRSTAF